MLLGIPLHLGQEPGREAVGSMLSAPPPREEVAPT